MASVYISTLQIKPGMISVDNVYSTSGQLLVSAGTILSPRLISKLQVFHISHITVLIPKNMESDFAALPLSEPLLKLYENPLLNTKKYRRFCTVHSDCVGKLTSYLGKLLTAPPSLPDMTKLIECMTQLIKSGDTNQQLLALMHALPPYTDAVLIHSVNVAVLSYFTGVWLGFDEAHCRDLLLAGLFHDLGKLCVPFGILYKPSVITGEEYEKMKEHPLSGYRALCSYPLSGDVLDAVRYHHERCDGSGYPSGLCAADIPAYAKILAVADVFEAMTAPRPYRPAFCPFDVFAEFEQFGSRYFDHTIMTSFLENVALSYLNAPVQLSNSLLGTVSMINKQHLSRPIVHVDGIFYDLSKMPELSVIKML